MKRILSFMIFGMMVVCTTQVQAAPMPAYYQVMQAVSARDEAFLKYLVSVGVNINATDAFGQTPLCTTVKNQDYQGYELLLSQGGTAYVPCMRQMDPAILNQFTANQPPLGTYYKTAPVVLDHTGELATPVKDIPSTIASLPFPHWGEFLIGGLVVGAALAAGSGGGGHISPVNGYSWDAPLSLPPSAFSAPTVENLSLTKKEGISDVTEELAQQYENEYAGGLWEIGSGLSVVPATSETANASNINFLQTLKADEAYARGYSGAIVNRNSKGILDGSGWDAVSDDKVTVAVMDTGLAYHTDFSQDLYTGWVNPTDSYKQSIGLNYEYGAYNATNNNSSYWKFEASGSDPTTGTLYLYKNGGTTPTVGITDVSLTRWQQYAGKFAPKCGLGVDQDGNCLKLPADSDPSDNYYTVQYVSNYGASEEATLATYYIHPLLWEKYVQKYGTTGYVYRSENATPNFFEDSKEGGMDHGTHVAGIIGASRDGTGIQGVAYNAKILPVKLDFARQAGWFSEIAEVSKKAKIINLSVAPKEDLTVHDNPSSFLSNNSETNGTNWNTLLTTYGYDYEGTYPSVAKNQTVQVFAAGNNAQYQPSIFLAAPLISSYKDAFKDLVIAVVSLGDVSEGVYHGTESKEKTGDITAYSNRCGAAASYCLSAPGGGTTEVGGTTYISSPIVSPGVASNNITNAYKAYVGTSQAAPMVSASLAVVMGAFPFLTSQEAVQILFKTATYIEPATQEIDDYNALAVASGYSDSVSAYDANTVAGEYNAIYGHGLVNLEAATNPVGLAKITFDTKASSSNTALAGSSSLILPSEFATSVSALPQKMIILDDYNRAFTVSTDRFIKVEKKTDALQRSFRSFMAQNEKQVEASDQFSFAFSEAPKDKNNVKTGSVSMLMRPNKDVKMRFGFTEDTVSFGKTYRDRILMNPFMNMRQAFGVDTSVQVAKDFSLTGSWYSGKNGFIDEKIFDKMTHQPRVQLVESGVAYEGIDNLKFSVSAGMMNEDDSMLGMQGSGAFDMNGSQTRFISAKVDIIPYKNFRLSGSYTYGQTEASKVNSLLSFSRMTSDSFAVVAEYQPDDKKTFGMKMLSPLRVRSGSAMLNLPVARDMYEDRIYREVYSTSLKPSAREYDLSFFYTQDVVENLSWAGETGVRLNPDHQSDVAPDYRALFKVNWVW